MGKVSWCTHEIQVCMLCTAKVFPCTCYISSSSAMLCRLGNRTCMECLNFCASAALMSGKYSQPCTYAITLWVSLVLLALSDMNYSGPTLEISNYVPFPFCLAQNLIFASLATTVYQPSFSLIFLSHNIVVDTRFSSYSQFGILNEVVHSYMISKFSAVS